MSDKTKAIRRLNDQFRQSMEGGHVVVSNDIAALSERHVWDIVQEVQLFHVFHTFNEANDPDGLHDYGSFKLDKELILWKIDCYNHALDGGSPDPADPEVTTRVLTIMRACEY